MPVSFLDSAVAIIGKRAYGAATVCLLFAWILPGAGCARDRQCDTVVTPVLPPAPCSFETTPARPRVQTPKKKVADTAPSIWPVQHPARRVSSPFGQKRSKGRVHKGIDIESPRDTPVMATAAGRVVFAGRHGAYGNIIVIDHGYGYETAYAHLGKCLVKEGDEVRRGQEIGLVGNTGNATAYHVHYEVRRNGVPEDPEKWLP